MTFWAGQFFTEGNLSHYFKTFGIPGHHLINASSNSTPLPRRCDQNRSSIISKCSPGYLPFLMEKHLGCSASICWTHSSQSALHSDARCSFKLMSFSHVLLALTKIKSLSKHREFMFFLHREKVHFLRSNIRGFNCDYHPTWHIKEHRIVMSTSIKEDRHNQLGPNTYYTEPGILRKNKEWYLGRKYIYGVIISWAGKAWGFKLWSTCTNPGQCRIYAWRTLAASVPKLHMCNLVQYIRWNRGRIKPL